MRYWSKRSLDNLAGIHPQLRRVCDTALHLSPIDFIVIEGLRDLKRQRELVSLGFSRTLNSRHLTGHAVDLWPISPLSGKAVSGRDPLLYEWCRRLSHWVKVAAEAERTPITWGGDWPTFRDGPHYELPRGIFPA